jgi:hypothetical protein
MLKDEYNSDRYYVLAPDSEMKIPFAKWVAQKAASNPAILDPLKQVVEWLRDELVEVDSNGD